MQINPRRQLLDIWSSLVRHSVVDGKWNWGERGAPSSVEDAERLLCLMYPATEIPAFQLVQPDLMQADVEAALKGLGGRLEIPTALCEILSDFVAMHTAEDLRPSFSGGGYFAPQDPGQELTPEQRALGVVDSFSMSVSLCLATLGFLKVHTTLIPPRSPRWQLAEELKEACEARLTAAMVSLLRSFTVRAFDAESEQGRRFCRLIRQGESADRVVVREFQRKFRSLRATLRDALVLGVDVSEGLSEDHQLFECGWAWGIVRDAPQVETTEEIGQQPEGCAEPVPSLYFTVVALDGIADLFSERTLTMGLLTIEQQRLAEALRLRWEVTQQYWSGIARFSQDKWPLEDIPWRTTADQLESEYFSLSVAAILVHDLVRRRATDDDLTRVVGVMERLAERGRVTSRLTQDDTALRLHTPGISLPLAGGELLGPPMRWTVNDFSAQLLKRTVQLADLARNLAAQDRLLRLAEHTMDHLWLRRVPEGEGAGLWDGVRGALPGARTPERLSWRFTERVVEGMVVARQLFAQPPLRSADLAAFARDLISEATHLLGVEQQEPLVRGDGPHGLALKSIQVRLRRARQLADEQPGTAAALTMGVLTELDTLAVARHTAAREP